MSAVLGNFVSGGLVILYDRKVAIVAKISAEIHSPREKPKYSSVNVLSAKKRGHILPPFVRSD